MKFFFSAFLLLIGQFQIAQAQVTVSGTGTGFIPAGTSRDVSFNFSGFSGNVGAVSLDVSLSSSTPLRLSGVLKSPGAATQTQVWSSPTSGGVSTANLTFNSSGSSSWDGNSASGTFLPLDSFSAFNGLTGAGTWILTVTAGSGSGAGTLISSASLTLTAVPEPTTYAIAFGFLAIGMSIFHRFKK